MTEKRHYDHYMEVVRRLREEVATLKQQVNTDPLTGLFSKVFMYSEGMLLDAKREASMAYAVATLDVDGFKKFANDTYGHNVGDKVLQVVAKAMSETFRPSDACCRPSEGGDEFVVIMPELGNDLDIESFSHNISQRLTAHIHKEFDKNLSQFPELKNIGISVGVATSIESEGFGSVLDLADKRMYNDKRSKGVSR